MNFIRDVSKVLCLLYKQAILIHPGFTFLKIIMYAKGHRMEHFIA